MDGSTQRGVSDLDGALDANPRFASVRSAVAALGIGLTVVLLASACGGSSGTSETSGADGGATPFATAETVVTPTPAPALEDPDGDSPSELAGPAPVIDPDGDEPAGDGIDLEGVARDYYLGVLAIATDPAGTDVAPMAAMQDPNGSLATFGEEFAAQLLATRRYLDDGSPRIEAVPASTGPRAFVSQTQAAFNRDDLLAVDFCVQNSGMWRALDTDELVRETRPEPFRATIWVSERGLVWSLTEHLPYQACEFASQ